MVGVVGVVGGVVCSGLLACASDPTTAVSRQTQHSLLINFILISSSRQNIGAERLRTTKSITFSVNVS